MADGNHELASHPLVYTVRHIPRGRKQAQTTPVVETLVVRLPSWSAEQAPVVATLVDGQAVEVLYRAVRLNDGSIRLVAPIGSPAHLKVAIGFDQEHPLDHSSACIFRHGRTNEAGLELVARASPDIGTHLSDNRAQALRHAERIRAQMVLVNGLLHAPCNDPGWEVRYLRGRPTIRQPYNEALLKTVVGLPTHKDSSFVQFCADPEPAVRTLRVGNGRPLRIREHGSITEHVGGVFGADLDWLRVRMLAEDIHAACHASSPRLLEDEMASIGIFYRAVEFWPKTRDMELARRALTMARVVHSISAASTAHILDELVERVGRMTVAGPPGLDLETRLELAGIVLPALPNAMDGVDIAAPGGLHI